MDPPKIISDEKKELHTITRRFHRFVVDDADATEEMRARAITHKDVIIVNIQ